MHKPINKKIGTTRNCRIEARVTESELNEVVRLAERCGLTVSNYIRRCALGQHPKQRLNDREIDALCSLTDARSELIHIRNVLKGRSQQERQRYFGNPRFMEQWIVAVNRLIKQWDSIVRNIGQ